MSYVDPDTGEVTGRNTPSKAPENSMPIAQIASSIGFIVGVVYAFKTKSGFWKGWGYGIIGSVALGGLGYGIEKVIKK